MSESLFSLSISASSVSMLDYIELINPSKSTILVLTREISFFLASKPLLLDSSGSTHIGIPISLKDFGTI